ncbi:MAG: transposase [Cyanobacteria bacterium J06648_11]
MTSKDKLEDSEGYQAAVRGVCDIYAAAPAIAARGGHVVSTDEKTGMQAIERKYPTKPTQPGLIERREFEYIRHGTQCLIANFDVATGRLVAPSIGQTRTERDFAVHIAQTIDTDPDAEWIFVVDQLNTHMSPSLVHLVAERCGLQVELGTVRRHGPLKNMKSRKQFLSSEDHRIRFVFTPRHCSWLNQIEIWFSILARRVLRRGSFVSIEDLRARVLDFIDYFNAVLAKPFRWTYAGRPLQGAS